MNVTWPRARKQVSKAMSVLQTGCSVQWGHRGERNGSSAGKGASQMSKISVGRGGKIFPGREQHKQSCRDHRNVPTLFGILRGAGMKIRLNRSSRDKTYTTQFCLPARLITNHLPLCCLSFLHTSFSHPRTFAHDFARVRDVLLHSLGCLPWTFRSRGLHRADHHIHRGIFLHNKSEVILFVYSFIICSPKPITSMNAGTLSSSSTIFRGRDNLC